MAPLDFLSLLTGVVGTLIAVWVAFAGKQLLRPRFSVEIGFFETLFEGPKRRWPWQHNLPISAVAVGVTALEAKYVVLPLVLHLKNRGSLPVSDLDVVLELPEEALIEKEGIVGPVAGQAAKFRGHWPEGRECTRYQGVGQSRIPLGLVRPGETMITAEFIQLRAGLLASAVGTNEKAQMLRQRYASCQQLRSAIEVRVSVWSSSMRPVSLSVMMLWFAVESQQDLEEALGQMARASADAGPIESGLYFSPPWSRIHRDELVEMAMVNAEKASDWASALSVDGLINNAQGAAVLRVPPWGLWGESFDVTARWNVRLRRRIGGRDAA